MFFLVEIDISATQSLDHNTINVSLLSTLIYGLVYQIEKKIHLII
jgi:hypothetical protein